MSQPEVTLTLSVDKLNVVMAGLGKLPLETSIDLWAEIKKQAEEQLKPKEIKSEPELVSNG